MKPVRTEEEFLSLESNRIRKRRHSRQAQYRIQLPNIVIFIIADPVKSDIFGIVEVIHSQLHRMMTDADLKLVGKAEIQVVAS